MAFNLGAALGAGVNTYVDTNAKIARTRIDALQGAKLEKEFAQEGEYDESFRTHAALGQSNAGEVYDQGIDYGNAEQNAAVRSAMLKLKPEEQQALLKAYKGSEVDQSVRAAIPAGAGATNSSANGAAPFVARTDPNIVPTVDFYGKPVTEAAPASAVPTAQVETPVAAAPQRQGIDLSNVKISGGTPRSHEDITAAVMEDMARSGNMAGWTKAAAINKLAREVTAATATDKIFKESQATTAEWDTSIKKNGVAATIDAFSERLAAEGINVKNVIGKDGKAGVAILDSDGRTERVLNSTADISKEFHSAHRTFTMQRLSTIPGTSAKDAVSIYADMEKGNYYSKDIKLKEAMQPYLMRASTAATNASNASAAHSAGAESRAAALQPTALRLATAGAENAEVGKVKGSFTAEDGQIVNEMDNGKFRWAGNGKVIDGDQFATMKLTPMSTRNGSVAQTHTDAATGELLYTRNDDPGMFNAKGQKVEVASGMAVPNAQAKPRTYPAVETAWQTQYGALQKSGRYDHNGSQKDMDRVDRTVQQDQDTFYRQAGQPTPSQVRSFNSGVFPTGTRNKQGKDISGMEMPSSMVDEFFKKHPTARQRAISN